MDRHIKELLYRSLDSPLGPEEQEDLNEALKTSPELRREQARLLAQREAAADGAVRSFGPFFAEKVMTRVNSLSRGGNGFEAFYASLMATFRRFALVGGVIMLALIFYNLSTGSSLNTEDLLFASDFTLEEIRNLPLF